MWFLAGGSHNSVAIEMRDHMIVVETPLNDMRTGAVLDQVKQLAPGKPIRFAINSHVHFDHSGGVRAAVAEGATIVTHAANEPYFAKVFATPNRIAPDKLAASGRKPTFRPVSDKLVLSDGRAPGRGLMVYLPKERLLIEADAYTPLPPNTPPPAAPNANNAINLISNIEKQKFAIDRILPLHGGVVQVVDLYTTASAPPPRPQ